MRARRQTSRGASSGNNRQQRGRGTDRGRVYETRDIRMQSRRTLFLHWKDMWTVASVDGSIRFDQIRAQLFGRAVDVSQTCISLV